MTRSSSKQRPGSRAKGKAKSRTRSSGASSAPRKTSRGSSSRARKPAPSARKQPARTSSGAGARKRASVASTRKSTGARKTATTSKKSARARLTFRAGYFPIIVIAAVVLVGWYLYPVLRIHYAEQAEVTRLEEQLTELQDRNVGLRDQVEHLKTPEGVEAAARQSLGYVRPGENLYVVTVEGEDPAEAAVVADASADTGAQGPLWQSVLDFVFGLER